MADNNQCFIVAPVENFNQWDTAGHRNKNRNSGQSADSSFNVSMRHAFIPFPGQALD